MQEYQIEGLLENLFLEIEKRKQLLEETLRLKKEQEEMNFTWKAENAVVRTDLKQSASKASIPL